MSTRLLRTLTFIAVSGIAADAVAGVIRHDVSDVSYTDLAAQSPYSGVGDLLIDSSEGKMRCSGTLIDASWVLTAAHCLDNLGTSAISYSAGGVTYNASQWVYHNSFDDSQLFNGFDIGLIQLNSAVSGVDVATLYTAVDEFDRVGTSVGFGNTGTGTSGYQNYTSGTKRAGTNMIEYYAYDYMLWADFDSGAASDSYFGDTAQLALEYLIAPGDSGGGLFVNIDGTDYLAGVHSFIASVDGSTNADYGDIQGSTRVSSYLDWIEDTTGLTFNTARSGGDAEPVDASVPSLPTPSLLLLGLLALRRRAHRLF